MFQSALLIDHFHLSLGVVVSVNGCLSTGCFHAGGLHKLQNDKDAPTLTHTMLDKLGYLLLLLVR